MNTRIISASVLMLSGLFFVSGAVAEEKADRQAAEAVAKVVSSIAGSDAGSSAKCLMKETAQLSVTLNFMESNPRTAKNVMDKRTHDVEEVAKTIGIKSIELQNYNFNLYPQNNNNSFDGTAAQYQVNGSLSFMIQPADKAVELMEKLLSMKIQSSLNVNGYRDSCSH